MIKKLLIMINQKAVRCKAKVVKTLTAKVYVPFV